MKKILIGISLSLCIGSYPIVEASQLKPNETLIEAGGAFVSHGEARSFISESAHAQSGYAVSVIHAINDRLSVKYNASNFLSEDKELLGIVSNSRARTNDINFIYRLNDYADIVFGYEHNKFTYGAIVNPEVKTTFQAGFNLHKDLNDKAQLYAVYLKGKDTSLAEIGIQYDLTPNSKLSLSYGIHEVKDVDLTIDCLNIHSKVDYKMSGLLMMYGAKL